MSRWVLLGCLDSSCSCPCPLLGLVLLLVPGMGIGMGMGCDRSSTSFCVSFSSPIPKEGRLLIDLLEYFRGASLFFAAQCSGERNLFCFVAEENVEQLCSSMSIESGSCCSESGNKVEEGCGGAVLLIMLILLISLLVRLRFLVVLVLLSATLSLVADLRVGNGIGLGGFAGDTPSPFSTLSLIVELCEQSLFILVIRTANVNQYKMVVVVVC